MQRGVPSADVDALLPFLGELTAVPFPEDDALRAATLEAVGDWRDVVGTPALPGSGVMPHLTMQGNPVFRWASFAMAKTAHQALDRAGVKAEDLDVFVPHQANMRIIRAAARAMDVPLEQFIINIEKYANTGAASVPIAICEALDSQQIQPDDTLLISSFGAGLTWATAILQIAPTPHPTYPQAHTPHLIAVPA